MNSYKFYLNGNPQIHGK